MRTPGADFELAVGFLFAEGVIDGPAALASTPTAPTRPRRGALNIVEVELRGRAPRPARRSSGTSSTTSACGVCGKAGLEALTLRLLRRCPPGTRDLARAPAACRDRLREAQGVFGDRRAPRRGPVRPRRRAPRRPRGRGAAQRPRQAGRLGLLGGEPAAGPAILVLVSGRSSYEILQKALAAGCRSSARSPRPQPGGGAGQRLRDDPGRLPARRPLQRLLVPGADHHLSRPPGSGERRERGFSRRAASS